jgi:hypothetical protein
VAEQERREGPLRGSDQWPVTGARERRDQGRGIDKDGRRHLMRYCFLHEILVFSTSSRIQHVPQQSMMSAADFAAHMQN